MVFATCLPTSSGKYRSAGSGGVKGVYVGRKSVSLWARGSANSCAFAGEISSRRIKAPYNLALFLFIAISRLTCPASSPQPADFGHIGFQGLQFSFGFEFFHYPIFMRDLAIQTQSGTAKIFEDRGIKLQALRIVLRHIFLRQSEVEVGKLDLVAVNIFALFMLADQLAVGKDDALVAIFKAVAVEFEKRDLGPIEPFFLFTSQRLIGGVGLLFLQFLPGSDLTVEGLQVRYRSAGSEGTLLDLLKLRQYSDRFGRCSVKPIFALTHNLILRDSFLVFV